MVCAYFAHVADSLSTGIEDADSVRARGDKPNWTHGQGEELSLPGVHALCTRRSGMRKAAWAASCGPAGHGSLSAGLEHAKGKQERQIAFVFSLNCLIMRLSNKINLFNSLLIYFVGMMPK